MQEKKKGDVMTINEITELGIKKAKQSISRYKISAIGFNKKGEMVGSAFNIPRFDRYGGSIHAEENLIRQYKNKLKTIIICRVNKNGSMLPIKACDNCKKLAAKYGIKIFSVNE